MDILAQPLAPPLADPTTFRTPAHEPKALSITIQHPARHWCEPVVVTLTGSLKQHTTPLVANAIGEALRRRPAVVLLSLLRITTVDTPGLIALLAAAHAVALSDGRLRTVAPPGSAAFHAITTACLTKRLTLRQTLTDALIE